MKRNPDLNIHRLVALLLLTFIGTTTEAKNEKNIKLHNEQSVNSTTPCFTENKGQVHDQNYGPRPDILFGGSDGNLVYHLKNNGLSYQLSRIDQWKEVTIQKKSIVKTDIKYKVPGITTTCRVDITWLNANTKAFISKGEAQHGASNYYLESCPNGALNVKSYESVTYKNIYPGIDLKWYQKNGHLKYDYIVGVGADYKQIQLQVTGADKISINAMGEAIITTPLGDITEQAPVVEQDGKILRSEWVVRSNTKNKSYTLCFEIKNLNPIHTFVIDPAVRAWGTYYGGGSDFGNSCITDASGNVYMSGQTDCTTSTIIATSGAHQTTHSGSDMDAFLVKFNGSGVRLWGTYYGAAGTNENSYSCSTDAVGNVYMAGNAGSSNVITTAASHQPAFGGGNADAFLTKFNSSGVRIWATYYGGSGDDGALTCTTDFNGNVYLGGFTETNTSTLIATNTSHQPLFGGSEDAFLVKFNSQGQRLWGTYYGSNGNDVGNSCSTDGAGNVYLTGSTEINTGTAIATPGSHQPAFGGSGAFDVNAYLVKFDANGVRQWGTFYGTIKNAGYSCVTDVAGNVYMAGETNASSGSVISTPGSHQSGYGGGILDAYLVKFNSVGARQWGTYYGGSGSDNAPTCAFDPLGNICLCGVTTSTDNIATPASHQTNLGTGALFGGGAFLAKFNLNGVRQWGSYYYGDANSCSFDASGNLFVAGETGPTTGTVIATPGSHQPAFIGSFIAFANAFLAKFNDGCTSPPVLSPISGATLVCAGVNNYSVSPATGSTTYSWSLSTGWTGISTSNIISVSAASSGTIGVAASNTCGASPIQTLSVTVVVCNGIAQIPENDLQAKLFPNPNSGELNVVMNFTPANTVLEIYDIIGHLVLTENLVSGSTKLNVSELTKGIYIVRIKNNKDLNNETKLIIQ